jgi:hypothetical protein
MPDAADPTTEAADPLTAALEEKRAAISEAAREPVHDLDVMTWRAGLAAGAGSALLAALEAALKLADDLDTEAARLLATAARLKTGSAAGTQNRAWAHRDCAEALREVITRELSGEGGGDAPA